jgi:gluconate 2-dehydrogenase gamma chain
MDREPYSRRTALKHMGLLMASVAGQEFLAGWLPSASLLAAGPAHMRATQEAEDSTTPAAPYVPRFFNSQEFLNIEILSEMIIPRDDKPGAKDARVADYIDFLVFSSAEFEPAMQAEWKDGLALLERLSQKEFGDTFAKISDEQRNRLLTAMSLPESDPNAKHEGFAFFRLAKEATVEGFYTSRVGLMEALEYKGLTYLSSFPGCTHPEHQS